jgi:uncharacterized protein YjbJ (UPF0337 family)
MTKLRDKVEARTKQFVGQIIDDDKLMREGQEEERKAESKSQSAGDARKHVPQRNKRSA